MPAAEVIKHRRIIYRQGEFHNPQAAALFRGIQTNEIPLIGAGSRIWAADTTEDDVECLDRIRVSQILNPPDKDPIVIGECELTGKPFTYTINPHAPVSIFTLPRAKEHQLKAMIEQDPRLIGAELALTS